MKIEQEKDRTRLVRDYTDVYSIKDFMINSIAPSYFDMDEINQFNIGLLGYTTELHSVGLDDTFTTMNTLMHEMFETRAILPSTLYTRASILGVDGYISATPSVTTGVIHVKTDDILKYGEKRNDEYVFVIDNDTVVDVNGKPYMFDYDIVITGTEYRGEHIFTSRFNMVYDNVISDASHPYIRTFIINHSDVEYVAVTVPLRQVEKIKHSEIMISSDEISFPVINMEHVEQFADMNVFYRSPKSDKFTQLEGRLLGGTPSRSPFYFYTLRDNNNIEVSFTTSDKYFKPEYNSEIKIEMYTTSGKEGNYKKYTGQNIRVFGRSDIYDYNNSQAVMFAIVTGESKYGLDRLTLEELRNAIVEKNATSGAYNSEDDLQLYLNNYSKLDNSFVRFIKKRDDVISRLFSGYILIKDDIGDYYPTNTLDMVLSDTDFDTVDSVTGRYSLQAGNIFRYGSDNSTVVRHEGRAIDTEIPEDRDDFIYTNPFLITFMEDPRYLGYYLNSTNKYYPVEFEYANQKAKIQFIVNGITVYRNAIRGENEYTVSVNFRATNRTIEMDENGNLNIGNQSIKTILTVRSGTEDSVAFPMEMVSFNAETQLFTFETKIKTNDSIVDSERFSCLEPYLFRSKKVEPDYPIHMNAELGINILLDMGDTEATDKTKFSEIEGFDSYRLANTYSTTLERVSFIKPMAMIQSQTKYLPSETKTISIEHVPLIGISHIKEQSLIDLFVNELHYIHDYLNGIIHKKTSNYSIDLKFYNTYGRSMNFTVGEEGKTLNRTNSDIFIQVSPTIGANVDELFRDIRMYIKKYIEDANKNKDENINVRGYNPIYISNLIQELENEIPEMNYMIFRSLNGYPSHIQVIENKTADLREMTSLERRGYVPEYLTIGLDDIRIDLISRC